MTACSLFVFWFYSAICTVVPEEVLMVMHPVLFGLSQFKGEKKKKFLMNSRSLLVRVSYVGNPCFVC